MPSVATGCRPQRMEGPTSTWLLIFGEIFSGFHTIPTGLPYLDYLAPGVFAQSTLFAAVFYGIQVFWERDAGGLANLLVTPTPRSALVAGTGVAARIRTPSDTAGWTRYGGPSNAG
jgi:hypothetical protein